jgi:hypothetical protein
VTLVLATFWIAGSAAWANGLSGLKNIASPSGYIETPAFWDNNPSISKLSSPHGGNFAPLTISVVSSKVTNKQTKKQKNVEPTDYRRES